VKGPETARSEARRNRYPLYTFFGEYMGGTGLDIGYRGSITDNPEPVLPGAIGVDRDYPGYNGRVLPFADESQDYVYSSHCLEHIKDAVPALQEWMRVVKTGGFLIITVPHRDLYEKKLSRPSKWNAGHKRFYTPAVLLTEVEAAFEPNSYRVRHLIDCDEGYDYSIGPAKHAAGEYQIELVLQKIKKPEWSLA
jgi:SAM-dependent methyltransferase